MSDWASGFLVGSVVATAILVVGLRFHYWLCLRRLTREYLSQARALGVEAGGDESFEELMVKCRDRRIVNEAERLVQEALKEMRPTIAAAKLGQWSGTERGQA